MTWFNIGYWIVTLGLLAWSLFTPKGRDAIGWFLNNFVVGVFKQAEPLLKELSPLIQELVNAFVAEFKTLGPTLGESVATPIGNLAHDNFTAVAGNLTAVGESTALNSVDQAAAAFRQAFGFGISSAVTTAAFEAVFPEKLNVLNGTGVAMAKMAGFDEVADTVLKPLYENAFGKSLEYRYRADFKPELPTDQDGVSWRARRVITDAQLATIFDLSGLKTEWEGALTQAAYRPVQPRALATMYIDVPFPTDTVRELLQFAGYRDNDIATMLTAFEFNSVKNVRSEYLAAVTRAAEMGTIDDPTLDSHLDSLTFSDQAKNYVHLTVAVKRLEQLAELYRRSVTALYETNQLDDSQYVPALQAIGINDADANAHFAIDSARKHGRELLKEERDLARIQGRETALAVQNARAEYFAGTLDDVAFGAAITVSGLPADLIPGTISLGVAQKSARRVEKYGLLLDRTHAEVLTEKVAALKEQVVKKLTPIDAASQTLDSFGIPPANRNALLSDWSAQALKTVLPV